MSMILRSALVMSDQPAQRSFVRPSLVAKIFRRRINFGGAKIWKKKFELSRSIRPRIIKIRAILVIFEPFEVRKFHMPFLGEFSRSSQDLCESDYDSIKFWDDRLNSRKSGMWIFGDRNTGNILFCLLYTSPSPRDATLSRMPSSA